MLPSTGVDRLLFVVLERVDAGVRLVLLVWLVAVAADSTDAEVLLAVITVIVKKDRSFQAHGGREHSTHCKLRKRMQIEKNKRKLRKIHQDCFKGTQRSDEPDCSSMLCEVQSPLTSSRLQ